MYRPYTCISLCAGDANVSFGALLSITAVLGPHVVAFSRFGELHEVSRDIWITNAGVSTWKYCGDTTTSFTGQSNERQVPKQVRFCIKRPV
jgi:hypothetical protein